ncbi:MAG: flavin reductase [bacterium]|nr:flavin reductase [bacterium]
MKKILAIAAVSIASMGLFPASVQAQDLEGFKEISVQKDFAGNAFTFFTKAPILASGDKQSCNAMTIGWGSLGNYLGYQRPTVSVYVAPGRYTYEFMERYPRFTVMEFDDPRIAKYMGSHSGRNVDKAKALNLHIAYTSHGTPYFKEAKSVIECEVMTAFHQTEKDFRSDSPKKFYKNFAAGVHTVYIGEVIGAWRKDQSC